MKTKLRCRDTEKLTTGWPAGFASNWGLLRSAETKLKFFTTEETKSWCETHGLKVTDNRFLHYENQHCITIVLKEEPSRVIALADYLVPTWEDVPFEGALLWIRQRGVWGDHSEKTGAMIVQLMRLAKGEVESLEVRPGHLFGPEELFEMHSHFVIPMLFGWDAFLVPENPDYFVFVSHDGVVEVVSRTAEKAEELRVRLRSWNPREDKTWYSQLVGQ